MQEYEVTQERTVKVRASTPTEAAIVANDAFNNLNDLPPGIEGSVAGPIRDTSVMVREEF